jgi:photosystem II stability/assembly factor-like uncharacterized protein
MNSLLRRNSRWLQTGLALTVVFVGVMSWPTRAQQSPDPLAGISFREIGPTRQGGRYVDVAVVEATPQVFYAASATGGLYKTDNNGLSFDQVFDRQPVASIGAVAVAQSNPSVVYVGTGEANNSRSTYWGDGVYVSRDAGATWTNTGIKESHHIARIVVHPTDPNTAYVAALGHLYSENDDRGLFKTVDGGKTWTKSLAIKIDNRDIGVVDVAMDPKNPLVLYAATYDKVRRPWTFAEGGPGSGIYKTVDAGKTWTKLSGGLPVGWLGRIGLSTFHGDSLTVYAVIENLGMLNEQQQQKFRDGFGTVGGSPTQMYRSDDAGKTWRQVAPPPAAPATPPAPAPAAAGRAGAAGAGAAGAAGAGAAGAGAAGAGAGGQAGGRGRGGNFDGGNPGYYYGQVRVDPNNKEHIFVLSVGASQSMDGGRSWQPLGEGGDNHALWINPKDSKHMILGFDHGLSITFNGGGDWYHVDNLPATQFYAVGYDMDTPYNVYGGLQDNGSQKGPSTRRGGGVIPYEEWSTVGGGDGMYNVVDWNDSRWLYNESQFGSISRVDQKTGQSTGIQYNRPQGQPELRWNWCAPILVSPHDSNVIYHGANVLLRSPFRGYSWTEISPDLTQNEPAKQGGGGNITYATITTIDESPIVPGLIWVGTDDGNVQLTRNGGATWTNLRDKLPGHPGYWVSRVAASNASAGTAYVSVTGLRNDDFRALLWKTTDFGETWASIASNLPKEAINVVREDPRNPRLLFVGTDIGVYASLDGGASWSKMKGAPMAATGGGGRGGGGFGAGGGGNAPQRGFMPTAPVHDLKIHPRDHELIAATHGRGIFIADIAALEELTPDVQAADAHLFEVQPVIDWEVGQRKVTASTNFAGMSRPTDMGISYFLKSAVTGDVKVRVYDGARVVAEMDGSKNAGINTVRWNLQARRERVAGEAAAGGRGGRGGGGGGFGRGGAAAGADPNFATSPADIGEYRVVLSVGGKDYSQSARIVKDPGR